MRRFPSFLALRAFEAAARLGGFTLASQELHLTPSAISHQVRSLERYFGRALFVRGSRRVSLTEEGARLQIGLSSAFDTIEAICDELSPAPSHHLLAIHCTPSLASNWLGPRLPAFMRRHPSISIRLSSGADRVELIRRADLDVLIAYGAAPETHGLVTVALGIEEVTAFCTPEMAAGFNPDDPAAWSRLVLIDSLVSPVRWSDWFQINKLPNPPGRLRPSFDRGALAISAAVQGMGVALETHRFVREELMRGKLVRLGGARLRPVRRAMHFVCYRAAQTNMGKMTAFRDWLVDQASSE